MHGRWNSLAGIALPFLLFTAIETHASEMLPRYTITDLGPYQDSIGGQPLIDTTGSPMARGYILHSGTYSVGSLRDPMHGYVTTGSFLMKEGSETNLLPPDIQSQNSGLFDVSSNGEVVGVKSLEGQLPPYEAFYYNSQTNERVALKNLVRPADYIPPVSDRLNPPIAYGINDLHQIVGTADLDKAILYINPLADPVVLAALVNNLGDWQLSKATDIDDQGRILGFGIRNDLTNERGHYYRLDPIPAQVPEPTSVWAFLVVSGVVYQSRRLRIHQPQTTG